MFTTAFFIAIPAVILLAVAVYLIFFRSGESHQSQKAAQGLCDHPIRWVLLDVAAVVINLAVAWMDYAEGESGWKNLLLAILMGLLLMSFGIKTLVNRINGKTVRANQTMLHP